MSEQMPENDAPACPCPALDCERQVACRPPAPTCPHPFYYRPIQPEGSAR